MKLKLNSMMPLATVCVATTILSLQTTRADEKHDHKHHSHEKADHKDLVGPNQGRVLTDIEPHAELFVTKDRKIKMTFIDDHGKVVPATTQSISIICGKRSAPTKLTFAKMGESLVSTKPLPEGKMIPTVIQVKMTPESKTTTVRLNLDLSNCPSCEHLEYACTCDHH